MFLGLLLLQGFFVLLKSLQQYLNYCLLYLADVKACHFLTLLPNNYIESVRATQLYRTLLHEIGHWVDFKKSIIENTTSSKDYNYLYFRELYKNRPSVEKEFFAHNFANKKVERLKEIGVIPFRRILDTYKMKQEGLTLTDFVK